MKDARLDELIAYWREDERQAAKFIGTGRADNDEWVVDAARARATAKYLEELKAMKEADPASFDNFHMKLGGQG